MKHFQAIIVMALGMVLVTGVLLGLVVQNLSDEVDELQNTNSENNARLELGRFERTQFQYQSLLLGCNSAGAQNSTNQGVRQLCDEELPRMLDLLIRLETEHSRSDLEQKVRNAN